MPFLRNFDDSDYDRSQSKSRSSHDFKYEKPELAEFVMDALYPVTQVVLDLLRKLVGTELRITYDGGNDEGFAHVDQVLIDKEWQSRDEIIKRLFTRSNVSLLRDAAAQSAGEESRYFSYRYQKLKPKQIVVAALEDLVYPIATQLLGRGFGTGEYELYGAATINLTTGKMIDDKKAKYPHDRT